MARKKSSLQERIEWFNRTHVVSVGEMVKLYRSGMTFKALAFKCGMKPQAVSNTLVRLGRITDADRVEHAKNYNNFQSKWRGQSGV